jgi:hypothetical protein
MEEVEEEVKETISTPGEIMPTITTTTLLSPLD